MPKKYHYHHKRYLGHRGYNAWSIHRWIRTDDEAFRIAHKYVKLAREGRRIGLNNATRMLLDELPKETPDGTPVTYTNLRKALRNFERVMIAPPPPSFALDITPQVVVGLTRSREDACSAAAAMPESFRKAGPFSVDEEPDAKGFFAIRWSCKAILDLPFKVWTPEEVARLEAPAPTHSAVRGSVAMRC